MLATDLEKSLRKFIRSGGRVLKDLSAPDVLQLAVEHWRSTAVDGLRSVQGDGLVAYFELLDRGRGTVVEFGVNRILRMPPLDEAKFWEWAPGHKLCLFFACKPPLEFFQLTAPLAVVDCWDKSEAQRFIEAVQSLPLFHVVAPLVQHSSGINLSECSGPHGDANHATKGLTWAIA